MLRTEFENAVRDAELHFQTVVTVKTPFVGRTMWLTGAILHYGMQAVYEVASVFYSSDALDCVPGINGCNRHRVFVDWIGKNAARFGMSLEVIEEAKLEAI